MKNKVEIYFTRTCPYCIRALRLLEERKIPFEGVDLTAHPHKREDMQQRTKQANPLPNNNGKTVPQIFINDKPIGGYKELLELDRLGKLKSAE